VSILDFEAAMAEVGRTLVAAHVAAEPLMTTHFDEQLAAVTAWAGPAGFNNVPVRRDGRVVGVLENINGDYADIEVPAARRWSTSSASTAMAGGFAYGVNLSCGCDGGCVPFCVPRPRQTALES
jgi:hypothetical protein